MPKLTGSKETKEKPLKVAASAKGRGKQGSQGGVSFPNRNGPESGSNLEKKKTTWRNGEKTKESVLPVKRRNSASKRVSKKTFGGESGRGDPDHNGQCNNRA